MKKNKVVTYSCSNVVYVYEPNCGFIPAFPYKIHKDIESAMNYLRESEKENIEIKTYKTINKTLVSRLA